MTEKKSFQNPTQSQPAGPNEERATPSSPGAADDISGGDMGLLGKPTESLRTTQRDQIHHGTKMTADERDDAFDDSSEDSSREKMNDVRRAELSNADVGGATPAGQGRSPDEAGAGTTGSDMNTARKKTA